MLFLSVTNTKESYHRGFFPFIILWPFFTQPHNHCDARILLIENRLTTKVQPNLASAQGEKKKYSHFFFSNVYFFLHSQKIETEPI